MKPAINLTTLMRANRSRVIAPRALAGLLGGCLLAALAPSARATSDAWDGSSSGVWATSANWLTDPAAVPGTGDTATFNGAGNGNTTIDLGGGVTISNLIFDTASAAAYTIGSGGVGAQTLSFDTGGGVTLGAGVANAQLLNANLSLPAAADARTTISNSSASLLTIAGGIAANVASGNGLLTLEGSGNTTINGAITKPGAGNNALIKLGSGTATITGNGTWSGNAAIAGPGFGSAATVREGVMAFTGGGVNAISGELNIGGVDTHGGPGRNAKAIINGSTVNVSSWVGVGRGNGVGAVTSELVLTNGALLTCGNFSSGYDGGSTQNNPKGSVRLYGSTLFSAGGVHLAESSASDMSFTLDTGSTFTVSNGVLDFVAGWSADSGGVHTLGAITNNGGTIECPLQDFYLGFWGDGYGKMVQNSGTFSIGRQTSRWLYMGYWDSVDSDLEINGGTMNFLSGNSSLKMHRNVNDNGNPVTHIVDQNGGNVIFYTDGGTNVGGTGNVDLQVDNGGRTLGTNIYNLNGGLLWVPRILSSQNSTYRRFYFNGGTLKAAVNGVSLMDLNTSGTGSAGAFVRNGGAIIDTYTNDVTIVDGLQHSDNPGDNATDGGLTVVGSGRVRVGTGSASSSYTGPTRVLGGTLALDPVNLANANALTVSNATLEMVNILSPLSANSLTLNGNCVLDFHYGNLSGGMLPQTIIVSGGGVTKTGTTTIKISAIGLGTGTFPLIVTGSSVPTNGYTLGALPTGVTAHLQDSGTSLDLVVTLSVQTLSWIGMDSTYTTILTNWDVNTSANWFNQVSSTPGAKFLEYSGNTIGDNVLFGDMFGTPDATNVNITATVHPATLEINSGADYRFSNGGGTIAGAATLVKNNLGSLYLGLTNGYTGGTVINGGSLWVINDGSLGAAGSNVWLNGGSLFYDGNSSGARPIVLGADSTIGVSAGATAQVGGPISGGYTVNKWGAGTLSLSATNAFTGHTYVHEGTIVLDSGSYVSNNTWNSIGVSGTDNGSMTIKGTGTFITTADFNSADIDASVGVVTIQDSAVLTANGIFVGSANNAASTANGTVHQTGGTVTEVSTAAGLFTIGGRNSGSSSGVGVYNLSGGVVAAASSVRIGGYGTGTVNQSGGLFQAVSNGINLARFAGSSGTYNLNGGVFETWNIASSTGSNAVFNFNGGTLKAARNNANFMEGLSQANVQAGGAIIDTVSNNVTINQGLLNAGGSLTKLGAGTLTLAGTNTYTGNTAVNAGAVILTPAHQVPTGPVQLANGTTLGISAISNGVTRIGNLTAGSAGTHTTTIGAALLTGVNPSVAVLECGTLTLNGTNTISLSGLLNPGTFPLIKYTGAIAGGGYLNPTALVPHGYSATVSNAVASSTIYVTVSGAGGIVWQGYNTDPSKTNLWDLNNTTNWLSGVTASDYVETTPPGDKVIFDDTGSGLVILSNTASPASFLITNATKAYTFQGPGHISGATGITKNGTNNATMAYVGNDYTGPTTINGGTYTASGGSAIGDSSAVVLANTAGAKLVIANTEVIGSLAGGGASGGNVELVGQLTINGGGTTTFGGNTSGGGRFVQQGTGTMTVTGMVATTGELWIGGGSTASTPTMNIPAGATVSAGNWWVVARDGSKATVNMTGGTIVHTGGGNITLGTLGTNPKGTINLYSGAISNMAAGILVGEGSSSATNEGTINQSGGLIYTPNMNVGDGNASIGIVNFSNGTMIVTGELHVGDHNNNAASGRGIFTMYPGATLNANVVRVPFSGSANSTASLTNNGGTINITSALEVARWDAVSGDLTLNSGQINLYNNAPIYFAQRGNSAVASFNQNGGNVTFYSDAGVTVGGTGYLDMDIEDAAANSSGTYTYNLNGGTLTVPQIRKTENNVSGTVFNFNGGTLKAAASNPNFMQGVGMGNVMVNGAIIDTAGHDIGIAQDLLNGDFLGGGLTKNGAGALYLNGTNSYAGATIVNAGSLGGTGIIESPVTIGASASLAPGASIGTLTINNNLTLNGGVAVEVNKSVAPSNDLCVVAGTITKSGAGTLTVNNLGPLLVAGDTFVLFNQPVSGGANLTITGGGPGVVWTNELATLGQIRVLSASAIPTTPTNVSYTLNAGNLTLSWPSNYLGWSLQAQTNTLGIGLSNNWVTIPNSDKVVSTNFPVNPANPTVFYRLFYQVP